MNTETMKLPVVSGVRLKPLLALLLSLALLSGIGCGKFFPPLTGTTGGGTTNTGDYAYVGSVNLASSSSTSYVLSGFSIGSGTLTPLSGLPITSLPFPPSSVAVNHDNSLLYVAGSDVIYGYNISSTGALTPILNSSQSAQLALANIVSMAISPDGQWLLALDVTPTIVTVDEFKIGSTGLLTLENPTQYALQNSSATIVPNSIAVSPASNYVAVALGTGGDVLFSFNTTTGALTPANQINAPASTSADQALTFDANGATLYIARSGTGGGVVPYTIGVSNSVTNLTLAVGAPFPLGSGPSSILVDASGKYLYVGNKVDSTISGFSIGTGGVLMPLGGSPYATGSNVSALGRDNSGKYILATALGGTPDLSMYSFDATTPGKLDSVTSAVTGDVNEPAGAASIALTH